MIETLIKPHKITKEEYGTHIYMDRGDKVIIKVYKKLLHSTMIAALHYLIGRGSRCYEEKHDKEIQDLKERVRFQTKIIVKYIEKYGQLRVKG